MDDCMTIDDFKRWKVDALKDYLRQRGLGVSGNKETLVARAFVAWELKLPKVLTPQEYRDNVKKDFSSLLATPGEMYRIQRHYQTGWMRIRECPAGLPL